MKFSTHLDHSSHGKAVCGTNWSQRWTYRVLTINTRRAGGNTLQMLRIFTCKWLTPRRGSSCDCLIYAELARQRRQSPSPKKWLEPRPGFGFDCSMCAEFAHKKSHVRVLIRTRPGARYQHSHHEGPFVVSGFFGHDMGSQPFEPYLIESVYSVVFQKSILTQIRQLVLHVSNNEG